MAEVFRSGWLLSLQCSSSGSLEWLHALVYDTNVDLSLMPRRTGVGGHRSALFSGPLI